MIKNFSNIPPNKHWLSACGWTANSSSIQAIGSASMSTLSPRRLHDEVRNSLLKRRVRLMCALESRCLFDASGLIDPAILDFADAAAQGGEWNLKSKWVAIWMPVFRCLQNLCLSRLFITSDGPVTFDVRPDFNAHADGGTQANTGDNDLDVTLNATDLNDNAPVFTSIATCTAAEKAATSWHRRTQMRVFLSVKLQ